MSGKPRRILGRAFLLALHEAGILHDGDYVRRVIIDARIDEAVVVHVERYGDSRLLGIVGTLEGAEVVLHERGDDAFDLMKELTVQNRDMQRRLAAYEAKEREGTEPS